MECKIENKYHCWRWSNEGTHITSSTGGMCMCSSATHAYCPDLPNKESPRIVPIENTVAIFDSLVSRWQTVTGV